MEQARSPIRLEIATSRRGKPMVVQPQVAGEHRPTTGIGIMQARLRRDGASDYLVEVLVAMREHCEWAEERIAFLERVALPHGRNIHGTAREEARPARKS